MVSWINEITVKLIGATRPMDADTDIIKYKPTYLETRNSLSDFSYLILSPGTLQRKEQNHFLFVEIGIRMEQSPIQ